MRAEAPHDNPLPVMPLFVNHLTRRAFLRNTALVGAASTLPVRSWAQVAGANSDVRVAVVGLNGRGPTDALTQPVGALDEDLAHAIGNAAAMERNVVAQYGASFDWNYSTDQFLAVLEDVMRTSKMLA